jgi:hypothetical protein
MAVKERDDLLEALTRAEEALREARSELERSGAPASEEAAVTGVTVRELAERFGIGEDAVVAFVETIGELLGRRPLSVQAARRGALLAAAGQAWENELGPLLTSAQVRELLGDVSRQRVDELLRARRLIGLRDNAGRRRFPSFQFHDGRPLEPLVAAYWTVADGAISDWTAASWCVSPDEALEGRTPAHWALEGRDPVRLARIARQDAARLAQ